MKNHNTSLALAIVPASAARPSAAELDARANLAALVSLGFARCPAPLVARSLDRGLSSTYALAQPECVGGLRAYELLLAPRPFASVVIRGLLHHTAPTCGMPSRHALVGMLAGLAGLCAAAIKEEPSELSDEALARRLRELDQAAADLEAVRRRYEMESMARGQRRGQRVGGKRGAR